MVDITTPGISPAIVNAYLQSMKAAQVDIVELGFRFIANTGFKGPNAFTTDDYLRSLDIPDGLQVGVMINGADMLTDLGLENTLTHFFPEPAASTPVDLVRFACHYREFEQVLPAVGWLHDRGYRVGFNLMQITDRSHDEVLNYARKARDWPVESLYFADSMGSMTPDDTARFIGWLREGWDGRSVCIPMTTWGWRWPTPCARWPRGRAGSMPRSPAWAAAPAMPAPRSW